MAKNHMPVAHFGVRPENVRADFISPDAVRDWNPQARATTALGDDVFVLDCMGIIGRTWDDTGITATKVSALLRMAGDKDVIVNIDSPGGDFFQGIAIYNLLRLHKGDVTTRVIGAAASAASIIALGGDRVEIAQGANFMIHNTRTGVFADAPRMENVVAQLRAFDADLADLYSTRTGIEASKIAAWMDRDNYFISARQAVKDKFADGYIPADQIKMVANDAPELADVKASAEFAMVARAAGLSRSQALDLRDRLSSKPSAADPGTSSTAETVAALMGSVKSFLRNEET